MSELNELRQRVVELEVAAKEGLRTIEWFESWLIGRDEPLRYDRDSLEKHPPEYTVNYAARDVAVITKFIREVINGKPIESV